MEVVRLLLVRKSTVNSVLRVMVIFGEGIDRWPELVGGHDSLASDDPVKTIEVTGPLLQQFTIMSTEQCLSVSLNR